MNNDFRKDYKALALDDGADWATAVAIYRRQVNQWHPDRFAQRPREQVHAQQRFIQLTRSFDALRNFYKENNRMPFEPPRARERVDAHDGRAGAYPGSRPFDPGNQPSEADMLEAGILNMRPPPDESDKPKSARPRWFALAASIVALTLGAFFLLDQRAQKAKLDEGREVLRRTAPSEFMPSATEVKKRSGRGAFVEGKSNPRIGDQLMQDIFR